MVRIFLPSILVDVTSETTISVEAKTVGDVIDILVNTYGEPLRKKLFDQKGEWVRFWQIFVNGINVRFLDYFDTSLDEMDEVAILPVVDGG